VILTGRGESDARDRGEGGCGVSRVDVIDRDVGGEISMRDREALGGANVHVCERCVNANQDGKGDP